MLKSIALTPARRRGPVGQPARHPRRDQHRAGPPLSYPDYLHLRDHDQAFSGLFGSALATVTLGRGRGARPVSGELVTGNYFHVLGVGAQRGRILQAVRRDRARPASGRRPQRRAVAHRLRRQSRHRRQDRRDQQRPAHRRRDHRRQIPRHDRQLRRRGVPPADDGARARLHLRQPARRRRRASSPTERPRSSSRKASCGRARRRATAAAESEALWATLSRDRPVTRDRRAAAGRAVLRSLRAAARPTSCRR